MKSLYILLFSIILSGCVHQPDYKLHKMIIKNESSHNVRLEAYWADVLNTPLEVKVDSIKLFEFEEKNSVSPPPPSFRGDSLRVVFDDEISITHGVFGVPVNRSWYDDVNWIETKISEYEINYEYIFTDEDYEEALERQ